MFHFDDWQPHTIMRMIRVGLVSRMGGVRQVNMGMKFNYACNAFMIPRNKLTPSYREIRIFSQTAKISAFTMEATIPKVSLSQESSQANSIMQALIKSTLLNDKVN